MRIGLMLVLVGLVLGCQSKVDQNTVKLDDSFSIYNPDELNKLIDDRKLTETERKTSIEALRTAFKSSYMGYELKKNLIGKSGDEIFDECLQDSVAAPMSSSQFYDEIKKCIARFQDTHINISKVISSASILTGISEALWIQDQLVIISVRPKLLSKFEELAKVPAGTYSNTVKKGTQVLEINGRPALEAVKDLEIYIAGSSPLSTHLEATIGLFKRNFHYPKETNISLKLRLEDGTTADVVLPWVFWSDSGSFEPKNELTRKGFLETAKLDKESLTKREGFSWEAEIFSNLVNRHEYYSEKNKDEMPVLVTGFAEIQKKFYCYMQMTSFSVEKGSTSPKYPVYEPSGDNFLTSGLIDVIKEHIKTCETFKASVIFDLRENGGGSPSLAGQIYSLFEKSGEALIFQGTSYSMRQGNLPIMFSTLSDLNSEKTEVETELLLKVYQEAQTSQKQMTSWVFDRNTKYETGVFSGKVVVLISPWCISACDLTARQFKASGRAQLVGQTTNGTGFGFMSTGSGETRFRDPYNLYTVRIPNLAFQAAVAAKDAQLSEDDGLKLYLTPFDQVPLLENHPTSPDVELKLTRKDINGMEDYINALIPLL